MERNALLDNQIERIRIEDVNRGRGIAYSKGAILSPGDGFYDLDADGAYSNSRRAYEEGGQTIRIISK